MVYAELAQAVLTGVGIAFCDDPGRGVRYAEVEDLARGDEVVEGLHHFGDAGVHVPVVDVELGMEDKGQRYSSTRTRGEEWMVWECTKSM